MVACFSSPGDRNEGYAGWPTRPEIYLKSPTNTILHQTVGISRLPQSATIWKSIFSRREIACLPEEWPFGSLAQKIALELQERTLDLKPRPHNAIKTPCVRKSRTFADGACVEKQEK
ncbi:MAG TPA: hypothetical protein VL975_00385 [Candidatus Micrarchaeia archaeon]|nr:hypothetical protein [Candidatus Micrarchaeia archaeon]